ncbi:HMG-I and HMG-Y, DNA-binding [Clostridium sp. DL-VIII]|uniref:Mu transposase C-terminal domain-containing protein n=1 Tax=Clostridium sp. DL-VIII TaxID=641107 RepID=UPI00023B03CB|nr:Mu transposase C-terminal domain-containing protein [Clostridium sp. DL-VIII]EHJ02376.1 HMG-I and HMG-Y, DNA-binding [Clostridium sp. DL-VIII]
MIQVNNLLKWLNGDERVDRILWFDKEEDIIFLIDVKENKMPIKYRMSYIEDMLKLENIAFEPSDKYINILKEEEIPTLYIQYRDKAWDVIKSIVDKEPYVYISKERRKLILYISENLNISESTINRYLKRYWCRGKNKNALVPEFKNSGGRGKEKSISEDTKRGRPRNNSQLLGKGINVDDNIKRIFKLSINKYYNTSSKNPLTTTYQLMIKEYFRNKDNQQDVLSNDQLPTYEQFKYWFYKNRNYKKEVVSRFGSKKYEQKHRAILGNTNNDVLGPGSLYQIDATVADVYVVSEFNRNWIIGRPVLYMVLDSFSRMIVGFYVGLEGPSFIGAAMALASVVEDKVKLCKEYDIEIAPEEWPVNNLPDHIIADRGEMEGKNIESLVQALGIGIKVTPPFRADWKGCVEQNFRVLNTYTKPFLVGKVDGNFKERGDKDYRLDAKLTIKEFTKIIIKTILYHNNSHVLREYDRSQFQIEDDVKAVPIELWNWGIENISGRLKSLPKDIVLLNLMPTGSATVTSKGIRFNGAYYASKESLEEHWFEKSRNSGSWKINISYDLRKMDYIYIKKDNGRDYEKCFLLEHQNKYKNKCFDDVQYLISREKLDVNLMKESELQAKVNLMDDIERIVDSAKQDYQYTNESNTERLKGIDENRKIEKQINRGNEYFEIGEEGEIARKDNIEEYDFNSNVMNELSLLKQRQRERRENLNG